MKSKTFAKKGQGNGTTPESSQVSELSYDAELKQLSITYHNGKTYAYADVPEEVAEKAFESSSIGSFLAHNVKNTFSYRLLN